MPNTRRRWAYTVVFTLIAFVAAGCDIMDRCNPPKNTLVTPSTTAATGATAATAAPKSSAATAATGSTGASGSTAATPAPFSGVLKLGYDHPPFVAGTESVGGNSHGLACGTLVGVALGSTVAITLTGTTGQPATVNATVGTNGGFLATFPISQFGMLNASIASGAVKNATGAVLTGSVPAATPVEVKAGADVPCVS